METSEKKNSYLANMEQTTIAIDIDKPMRLVQNDGQYAEITEVLYHNDEVCLCEIATNINGGDPAYLFSVKSGKVLNGSLAEMQAENWTPTLVCADGDGSPMPSPTLSERAREFARRTHRHINQLYDGKPYIVHLDMAAAAAHKFKHLVPNEKWEVVLAGVYLHDSTEDSHALTFNPLVKEFGEEVANLAYACENEKGKTREERANAKYYQGIRDTPFATFVKLCDRIANISHGGSMKKKYRKENAHFKAELYDAQYQEMFDHIEQLLA